MRPTSERRLVRGFSFVALSRLAMYLSVKTRMANSMLYIREAPRFSVLKECNGPFSAIHECAVGIARGADSLLTELITDLNK